MIHKARNYGEPVLAMTLFLSSKDDNDNSSSNGKHGSGGSQRLLNARSGGFQNEGSTLDIPMFPKGKPGYKAVPRLNPQLAGSGQESHSGRQMPPSRFVTTRPHCPFMQHLTQYTQCLLTRRLCMRSFL